MYQTHPLCWITDEMEKSVGWIIKSESSEKDKNSSVWKYQKDTVVGWSVVDTL